MTLKVVTKLPCLTNHKLHQLSPILIQIYIIWKLLKSINPQIQILTMSESIHKYNLLQKWLIHLYPKSGTLIIVEIPKKI